MACRKKTAPPTPEQNARIAKILRLDTGYAPPPKADAQKWDPTLLGAAFRDTHCLITAVNSAVAGLGIQLMKLEEMLKGAKP